MIVRDFSKIATAGGGAMPDNPLMTYNKFGVSQHHIDASTIKDVSPINKTLGVVTNAEGVGQRTYVKLAQWEAYRDRKEK
ncbi:hypothetical protein [uncultured Shimia sp.]|uniref:hypothetical protein n=1 Tax=uncultured Shimia sp. TaxID=573152 RepID=UPI00260F5B77|nr:hypothetical protein [uncultured Shimia sp.]